MTLTFTYFLLSIILMAGNLIFTYKHMVQHQLNGPFNPRAARNVCLTGDITWVSAATGLRPLVFREPRSVGWRSLHEYTHTGPVSRYSHCLLKLLPERTCHQFILTTLAIFYLSILFVWGLISFSVQNRSCHGG